LFTVVKTFQQAAYIESCSLIYLFPHSSFP